VGVRAKKSPSPPIQRITPNRIRVDPFQDAAALLVGEMLGMLVTAPDRSPLPGGESFKIWFALPAIPLRYQRGFITPVCTEVIDIPDDHWDS
jgi:hypothetical protein